MRQLGFLYDFGFDNQLSSQLVIMLHDRTFEIELRVRREQFSEKLNKFYRVVFELQDPKTAAKNVL